MTKALLDHYLGVLREAVEAHRLAVLASHAEGTTTRRLVAEVCRGSEISFQVRFGIHAKKGGALLITYTTEFRWQKAEEMMRELRPPSPHGPSSETPAVLEARNMLYPIAQLRIAEDRAYFRRPSPTTFKPAEFEAIPALFDEVLDILVSRAKPEFCSCCDAVSLARAVLDTQVDWRWLLLPLNVAGILAAAGMRQEFNRWSEALRNGRVGPPHRNAEAVRWQEQFLSALEARLPH